MGEYKIMFSGEILPGHDPAAVRERLVAALKAGPQAAERLFSGKPVSLKSGLDEAQAQAYRRRLAAMGVAVRVEALAGAAAGAPSQAAPTLAGTPAAGLELVPAPGLGQGQPGPGQDGEKAESALALVESVLADTMACPKCGHVQPKRNLCQSCGVDMARVREAQQSSPDPAPAAASTASPYAAPGARVDPLFQEEMDERPRLLGFSFEGRMPRLSYLLGGLAVTFVGGIVFALAAALGPVASAVATMVIAIPAWRLSVMRLHDINLSGWFGLLLAVPIVGSLLSLVLLFIPGTEGGNDYGPQAESHGWKPVLVVFGALLVGMSILLPWSLSSYQDYVQKARAAEAGQYLGGYDPDRDEIVLFSSGDCRPCGQRRQQLLQLGVRFDEVFVDEDEELSDLLSARLRQAGHSGQLSLPVIEVNGELLPGNPSLREMAQYFGTD